MARTRDWSNRSLRFRVDATVCYFGAIGDGFLFVALEMAWVLVGRGFLVEGNPDADESLEGVILADNGRCSMMSIQVQEIKQRFWSSHD